MRKESKALFRIEKSAGAKRDFQKLKRYNVLLSTVVTVTDNKYNSDSGKLTFIHSVIFCSLSSIGG